MIIRNDTKQLLKNLNIHVGKYYDTSKAVNKDELNTNNASDITWDDVVKRS